MTNLAEALAEGRAEAPGAKSFLRATVPDDLMNSAWNRARPVRPQFARTHSQGNPRNVVRDRCSTTPRWRTGFWIGIDRCKPNSMAIGQRPHPGCVWAADPDPDRPDASTRPPPEVPIQFPGPGRMDLQVQVRESTMAILENPDPIFLARHLQRRGLKTLQVAIVGPHGLALDVGRHTTNANRVG